MREGYCKHIIHDNERWETTFHQCSRKVVKDGWCKIHHPDYIAEKMHTKQNGWYNEEVEQRIRDYKVAAVLAKKEGFGDAEIRFLERVEGLKRELL